MKIAILTCTTENRKWLYDITNPTKEKYCKNHNYDYIFSDTFYPNKEKGIYWLKPKFISENISEKYDWILWLDDDAGFINQNFDLEDFIKKNEEPNKLIYAAEDLNGLNAGVLLIKSCQKSKEIFNFIYEKMEPIYKNKKFQDQDALKDITKDINVLKLVDGKIINAYDKNLTKSIKNQRNEKSCILHIAGGTDFKLKHIDQIKEIYK